VGSSSAGATSVTSSASSGPKYALVRSDGWELREAVDVRGDEPTATITRPYYDWYAEYTRSVTADGSTVMSSVVLTGHQDTLGDVEAAMAAQGIAFEAAQAGAGPALIGRTDRSIVVVLDGDPVLMLVGNDSVSETDLLAIAGTVERVDGRAWAAAGGRSI
jgi:hypothetical protein